MFGGRRSEGGEGAGPASRLLSLLWLLTLVAVVGWSTIAPRSGIVAPVRAAMSDGDIAAKGGLPSGPSLYTPPASAPAVVEKRPLPQSEPAWAGASSGDLDLPPSRSADASARRAEAAASSPHRAAGNDAGRVRARAPPRLA